MGGIAVTFANAEQRRACCRMACEIFCGEMGTMRDPRSPPAEARGALGGLSRKQGELFGEFALCRP